MKMIPVSSSNLSAVGYDRGDSILVIHFRNGRIYRYLHVPEAIFDALMRAPSMGTFFNQSIKEKFQYIRG